MSARMPSTKTLAITLSSLVVAYLLFAWLALPRILQSQAENYIAGKAGHRLTLDRAGFNPFELSLRIVNLRLTEPDGKPLLAFKELFVDLSAASIFRLAWVFDGIRLDEPDATLVLQPDGRLNWSPLIEALKGGAAPGRPGARRTTVDALPRGPGCAGRPLRRARRRRPTGRPPGGLSQGQPRPARARCR